MFKWIIGVVLLASASGAVQAKAPTKSPAKAPAQKKAPSVMVCPITHEDALPNAKQSVKFGGETIAFCCADCKAAFAKLSPAQKKARVAEAKKLAEAKARKSG